MTVSDLYRALDGAELVRVKDNDQIAQTIAVWRGSHTINYYDVYGRDDGDSQGMAISRPVVEPTDTQSIGDYETGEVTREEAEDAIETRFEQMEEAL